MSKLGFIGGGNMASAMIKGVLSNNPNADIIVSDLNETILEKAKTNFGIQTTSDNKEVAKVAKILVLAVKPHFYETVIKEIKDFVNEETVVVAIAPGKTLEFLENNFGKKVKTVRTMPNTPAMVGQGMTAYCPNEYVTKEELAQVVDFLNSFGKASQVTEKMIDAVVAVSGSSPAYVYMFIEALADGAVMEGLPRDEAYKFAAQAVYGSAKMVLETGLHPAALKDMVCSPGGTTIEAVRVLEENSFRGSIMNAMKANAEKSRNM
ncbi:MAG: pyrroline-5-carboxylate reductase [Clostridia bacterium]